ncbi:MAG: hypothetical protein Q9199_005206 [Rusavskia elegans]
MATGVDAMPEHKEYRPIGSAELQGFQALRQHFNAAEEAEFLDALFDSESSKIHGLHSSLRVLLSQCNGYRKAHIRVQPIQILAESTRSIELDIRYHKSAAPTAPVSPAHDFNYTDRADEKLVIKVRDKVRDLPPLKDLEYNTLHHPPRSNFSAADFVIWNEASQKYFGISTTTTPELDINSSLMDVDQKGEIQARDYIHVFVKDLRHSEDENEKYLSVPCPAK